jgi:lysozyme
VTPRARWLPLVAGALVAGALGLAGLRYLDGELWLVVPPAERFPVRGIDVSHHQGDVDWAALDPELIQFAWIKASEGGDFRDREYVANRDEARAACIPFGSYHFLSFCAPADIQAANFVDAVGADPGDLPPAVDLETGGNCSARPGPREIRGLVDRFIGLVEASLQREMMIYVPDDQVPAMFGTAGPPDRDLWIRSVFRPPVLLDDPRVFVWQYQPRWLTGGVSGFVDRNALRADIAARWGLPRRACTPATPAPHPAAAGTAPPGRSPGSGADPGSSPTHP